MKQRILLTIGLIAVLVVALAGPVGAQTSRLRTPWLIATRATIGLGQLTAMGSTSLQATTVGSTLAVTGAQTNAASITQSDGNLTVADKLIATGQTTATVAMNGTITPVGTTTLISAAGAVGTSSIAAGTNGQLLLLVNVGSNAITITDTGTLKLAGNVALGQFDTLQLVSDGFNWYQIGTANN